MSRTWHILSPDALVLHRWGARVLVYNDLSGHTHLFDEMTTLAFDRLLAGPMSEEDIVDRLAKEIDLPIDARLREWSRRALLQMEKLGLITSEQHEGQL